jgi:hypothetical protein
MSKTVRNYLVAAAVLAAACYYASPYWKPAMDQMSSISSMLPHF